MVTFSDWTQGRLVSSLGTNSGAPTLPFQGWRHFKEAFAPELIAEAIAASAIPVRRCLDPFGGSGTTALACQFLGVHPTTIEVNPFLSDLIEVKLSQYKADALAKDFGLLLRESRKAVADLQTLFQGAPPTLIEPGIKGRWILNLDIATRVASILWAIERLPNLSHQKFFRVLLGGILIEVSNVVISGKGRRYRKNWNLRKILPRNIDKLFCDAVHQAIVEVHCYSSRACASYNLLCGDSRTMLQDGLPCDLAIFSPPYPNSFDYTDVYNVELWVLGYLTDRAQNQTLRISTLCSHVQINRKFPQAPSGSPILTRAMDMLRANRKDLWSPWIPEMIGGYFADLIGVLSSIYASLTPSGSVWLVVGESRYAGTQIETAKIVAELAPSLGYSLAGIRPFRSMRASAQQGGRPKLSESLVVLSKL